MTNNVRNKVFATPYGLISLAVVAEWTKEHFTNETWVCEVAISASSSDACDAPARTVLYQFVDTVRNYEQCIDLTPDRLLEVLCQFCDDIFHNWHWTKPEFYGHNNYTRYTTAVSIFDGCERWNVNSKMSLRDLVRLRNWCREQMEEQKERNA